MEENLNDTVAYLLIGAVALFLAAVVGTALGRRIGIYRSARRNRRSHALVAAAAPPAPPPPPPPVEPPSVQAPEPIDVTRVFDDFDRRFAELAIEIEALSGDEPAAG